jgi:hypothetical protein
VKKADLREYFQHKKDQLMMEQARKKRDIINSFRPTIEKELGKLDNVLKNIKAAHEEFNTFIIDNGVTNWYTTQKLSRLKDLFTVKEQFITDELDDVLTALKGNAFNGYTKGLSGEFIHVDDRYRQFKDVEDAIKKIETLFNEIEGIIQVAHSGKKAYEELKKQGIDMSDFEVKNSNVPLVQKLSVDPCIINGGCK